MTLKSMTGFSRNDGSLNGTNWHWELRSVNGRGLDIRLRLPSGYEALEQPVRQACAKTLGRGNCTINLNIKRQFGAAEIRLNEEALAQVVKAAQKVQSLTDTTPASVDGLLAMKGVLETVEVEETEDETKARLEAILASFHVALKEIDTARATEGERLAQAIEAQLNQIEVHVSNIRTSPARSPEAIKLRLSEQLQRLVDADDRLDPDRLHQEAVLIANKADIEEEVERLAAHIIAARELLQTSEPVGRRFDFLAQEFNREANTICAKSNDNMITKDGLEAKTLIDQMREQVQNIE